MANNPRSDKNWRVPFQRSEASTDYVSTLSRINWELFATLTFSGNSPKPTTCRVKITTWLHEVAKVCGVPHRNLLFALRGEFGECKGRFHYHCLIGGTTTRNYITTAHRLEHLWKILNGGARVEVRPYDRSLAGAAYIVKCLGANAYEADKFAWADSVTLSASILRCITHMDALGERRCGEHIRKDGMIAIYS